MAIKCYSLGAAQEVTGSKHLFEVDDRLYMIDCGSFQGKRHESDEKNRNFDVDLEKLDSVILTHGHLDHCGLLPLKKVIQEIFMLLQLREILQIL